MSWVPDETLNSALDANFLLCERAETCSIHLAEDQVEFRQRRVEHEKQKL